MTQSPGFILSGSPFLPLTHWVSHFCYKELFPPLVLLRLFWFSSPAKAWLEYDSQRLSHPHRTLHRRLPVLQRQRLQSETPPRTPRNAAQVVPLLTSPPSSDCADWVSTMFCTCWLCGNRGAWAELFPSAEWLCHADYMVGQGGLSALLGYRWRQEQRHCPSSAL